MRFIAVVLSLFFFSIVSGQDFIGGRLEYRPIGPSYCYPHCDSIAFLCTFFFIVQPPYSHPDSVLMKFWNKDDSSLCAVRMQAVEDIKDIPFLSNACVDTTQPLRYKIVRYAATVDFKPNNNGYYWAIQGCCRVSGFVNIAPGVWGWTYAVDLPPPQLLDSSPTWNY